jgi:hypothetical protein
MKVLRTVPLEKVNFRSIKGRQLIDMYQQLTAVIRARTNSADAADLLARPIVNRRTGELEWSTHLTGTKIEVLAEVEESQRAEVLNNLASLGGEIETIARVFGESGDRSREEDAVLFDSVLASFSEEHVFVVDGQPVLVNWGVEVAGEQRKPIELQSRVAVPAPIVRPQEQPAPQPQPALLVQRQRTFRGWVLLPWLLALSLVVLLLLVFEDHWLPSPRLAESVSSVAIDAERNLRKEIASLNSRILSETQVCLKPRVLPESPPELQPEPEPDPMPQRSHAACEPSQIVVPPSEIIFVLDTSSSMKLSVHVPAQLERRYIGLFMQSRAIERRMKAGDLRAFLELVPIQARQKQLLRQMKAIPGESRISIARQIASDAIVNAPRTIDIGMVSFSQSEVFPHGTFPPSRRNELVRRVNVLNAEADTPLAAAVRVAASRLRGGENPNDPVNMVVLTDGSDSCGGDPCAAAREAKQAKPGLIINVIHLSSLEAAKCMADLTGGFYRKRREGMDLAELSRSMREAAGYEGQGMCRPK